MWREKGGGLFSAGDNEAEETHPGRVTWVVPTGTISIDFPQNLFLHLTSTKAIEQISIDSGQQASNAISTDTENCNIKIP